MTTTRVNTLEEIQRAYPGAVYLDLRQSADLLQTSVDALRGRIKRGTLPATKLGPRGWRIPISVLAEHIDAGFNTTP